MNENATVVEFPQIPNRSVSLLRAFQPSRTTSTWENQQNRMSLFQKSLVATNPKFQIKGFTLKLKISEQTLVPRPIKLSINETETENKIPDNLVDDLQNMEGWVFEKLQKVQFFNERGSHPLNVNLDLKFLDTILREEQLQMTTPMHKNKNRRNTVHMNINKRIGVTAETINNEYNRDILFELIKQKVSKAHELATMDIAYIQNYTRLLVMDLISSFRVLKIFKLQSPIYMRDLLDETRRALHRSVSTYNISSKDSKSNAREISYRSFEKALYENYQICQKESASLKSKLSSLRDQINDRKYKLANKQHLRLNLIAEVDLRENPNDNRKRVFKPDASKVVDILDLRAQISQLEESIVVIQRDLSEFEISAKSEITKLENAITDLKFKKTLFLTKLKEVYFWLISHDNELMASGHTLVSVLKLLWSLKIEVSKKAFTSFLEPSHLNFLYDYTSLHNEFIDLKKRNNVQQQEFKQKFYGIYLSIVEESEKVKLAQIKKVILCEKNTNLRIMKREEVKSNVNKWREIEPDSEHYPPDLVTNPQSLVKPTHIKLDIEQSKEMTDVSEKLCTLKEHFIASAIGRVSKEGKINFTTNNAKWLKTLFTIFFGKKEAQFLFNELMKMKTIKITKIKI